MEPKRCVDCGDPKGPNEDICDVCGSVKFVSPLDKEAYAVAEAKAAQRVAKPVMVEAVGTEPNPPADAVEKKETKKEKKAREVAEKETVEDPDVEDTTEESEKSE